MAKEDTQQLIERATTARVNRIREVWHSAYVSTGGGPRVQALVGKSQEGFHPGLRHGATLDWGQAFPREDEAKSIAQCGASEWLRP